MTEVVFDHVHADRMPTVELLIRRMYVATHADVIDDPFYSEQRFLERVHAYARAASFELVIATRKGEPLSLALGYGLPKNARWWHGLTTPAEPELTSEDGSRTFALCELMTHPDWQGRGIAHAVHDELLSNRPECRASLLVRSNNETARQAYLRWGWKQVGKLKPFPDSPHYDVLNLDLASIRTGGRYLVETPVCRCQPTRGVGPGVNLGRVPSASPVEPNSRIAKSTRAVRPDGVG